MATITITVPDAVVTRVQDAFEYTLQLDEPATLADVHAYIVADLKQVVRNAEARIAKAALTPPEVIDFT